MNFKRLLQVMVGLTLLGSQIQCATDLSSNLETARFQLDQGNYTAAISAATAALSAEPGHVEASRILASAYFGRSGLNYLDIAAGLLDLGESTVSNFAQIAGVLPNSSTTTVDMADLRLAIETLAALSGIDEATLASEELSDAAFDLGTMQMIEHFALGVYQSDFFSGNDNSTIDVSGIADANREDVQSDLVSFDNRVIASGVSADEDFIRQVRQSFCILEPISAGEGFTLGEYQALVNCQLSDDPDTVDTLALSADIANCAALEPNDADPCLDEDTSL